MYIGSKYWLSVFLIINNLYQNWPSKKHVRQSLIRSVYVTDYHLRLSVIFQVHCSLPQPDNMENDSPYQQQQKCCLVEGILPDIIEHVQKNCINLDRGATDMTKSIPVHPDWQFSILQVYTYSNGLRGVPCSLFSSTAWQFGRISSFVWCGTCWWWSFTVFPKQTGLWERHYCAAPIKQHKATKLV